MYALAEYQDSRRTKAENGREAVADRQAKADGYPEPTPYVVRDLSWELARFLDAEDSVASSFATPDDPNGNPPHHE